MTGRTGVIGTIALVFFFDRNNSLHQLENGKKSGILPERFREVIS